jgi:hypothetical protein
MLHTCVDICDVTGNLKNFLHFGVRAQVPTAIVAFWLVRRFVMSQQAAATVSYISTCVGYIR